MWALSIVVAVVLWMFVTIDQNDKIFAPINDIPVEFVNVETLDERGLVISNPQEYSINIRVYGRRKQLYSINKEAIEVKVDLSRLNSKGSHFLPVNIYGIPSGIEISSKNPDSIEIVLDQIVKQERNIKIDIQGDPGDGMAALSYILDPTKATIEGAETVLNGVNEVKATIDISNASGEISRELPLKAVDVNGKEVEGVTITPENVDVTIPIGTTKSVPITPKITGEVSEDYLFIDTVVEPRNIRIGGTTDTFDDIVNISTENINITGQTESYEKKVKLLLPEGVEVIGGEAAVLVKVTIQPYIEKEYKINDINIINLNKDLEIEGEITQQAVTIMLKGIKEKIEVLKEEDIILNIDALNLKEGRHEVKIKAESPEGIILNNLTPNTITINLKKKEELLE